MGFPEKVPLYTPQAPLFCPTSHHNCSSVHTSKIHLVPILTSLWCTQDAKQDTFSIFGLNLRVLNQANSLPFSSGTYFCSGQSDRLKSRSCVGRLWLPDMPEVLTARQADGWHMLKTVSLFQGGRHSPHSPSNYLRPGKWKRWR